MHVHFDPYNKNKMEYQFLQNHLNIGKNNQIADVDKNHYLQQHHLSLHYTALHENPLIRSYLCPNPKFH